MPVEPNNNSFDSGEHNSYESYNVDHGNRFQVSICTQLVPSDGQAHSLC